MNEQLIVKNFGPIKDATVDFKRVTVFIGPTGGGKSTLAKLAATFRASGAAYDVNDKELFDSIEYLLHTYGILGYQNDDNLVSWKSNLKNITIVNEEINSSPLLPGTVKTQLQTLVDEAILLCKVRIKKDESIGSPEFLERLYQALPEKVDFRFQQELSKIFTEPTYIPAERVFASAIEGTIFGLRKSKIALPEVLGEFMADFENARKEVHFFEIPFLEIGYSFREGENKIQLKNKRIIELSESASGIQSVLPLLLVVDHLTNANVSRSFIIEEPELNLYPIAQQKLLDILVEKCTKGENDLTITTHSPYILSSCNLLLEAYKVAQQRPELADEIDKIVPRACWLNPDEFAAYYVADGTVRPITDERTHLIGGNELDAVSGDISDSFRRLLQLKKQVA